MGFKIHNLNKFLISMIFNTRKVTFFYTDDRHDSGDTLLM